MADLERTHSPYRDLYDPYNPPSSENVVAIFPNASHRVQPEPLQRRIWRLLYSECFRLFVALMVLFILLWTWCIAVAFHPIHVTDRIGQYVVWSQPKTVNFIATPISTGFVIVTSYLFTQSVGLAMRKNMAQKLDARAFLRWNAIANKHVNFQERPGWVTLTLLSFVVLQSLTTGFTPNFTPQQITITKSQKTFQELDMSSDAFLQVYRPISPDVPCRYGNYTFFSCSKSGQPKPLMVLEGGESSALTNLGYLASTNFVQTAFVNTSAGVMPLGGSRYSIWFAENSSKPTYESNGLIQNFTSYNVSYRQQGLTATVTCTSENTSPLNYTVAQSFPNGNSNLSIIMPTIVCNNAAPAPLAQLVVGTDFLLASSCSLANQTQYIYLRGYGAYGINPADGTTLIANMTCQLDPIFNTNIATFVSDWGAVIVYPIPNTSFSALPNSNTTLINDITAALPQTLLEGQSANGNTFADFIQGIVDAYPGQASPNQTVESMLQGMFEISGLSVNGYWSSKLFANGSAAVPFSRTVTGNLTYTLYGWDRDIRAFAGLIPFTIVIIFAMLLLVWSYDGSRPDHDPSDPLSLIVASAAGNFKWVSDVNIEMDTIANLSEGFSYKKVDGKWTLTQLSDSVSGK